MTVDSPLLGARTNIFEFVRNLSHGDGTSWIAVGIIVGCIAFFAVYKQVTGKDLVKSRKERRRARERRKHVLWKYERDS